MPRQALSTNPASSPPADDAPELARHEVSTATGATTPGNAVGLSPADLVDRVLALQPLGEEDIPTKLGGTSTAMFTYVLEITPDTKDGPGDAIDHLEHPIFWQHVRAALRDRTSEETPWVIGRIVKLDKAFVLKGVTPEDHDRAQRQIKSWALAMTAAEDAAAAAGDEAF